LVFVKDGDMIALDVENRTLHLEVSENELQKRRAAWKPPAPLASRGYVKFYIDHVQQAHLGADLDILTGCSGSIVARDLH
jgi:L-arabonate dehydrase